MAGIAVPRLKDFYEDFCLKKTLDETDTLIKSYRSYYLIFNQISTDTGCSEVSPEMVDFVPSSYVDKTNLYTPDPTRESVYKLTVLPYGEGLEYDFQNWISLSWYTNADYRVFLAISVGSNTISNNYLKKYKRIYSNSEVKILGADVLISFPEIPSAKQFDANDENRWY